MNQTNQADNETSDTQSSVDAQAQLLANNQLMASIAKDYLKDKKSARRWRWFYRILIFVLIGVILIYATHRNDVEPIKPHTALVDYEGMIGPDIYYTDSLIDSLQRAFEAPQSKAVVLRINSPGGLPVQAALVYEQIRRLKQSNPDKPIYVVATDMCASGCYYIAAAADQIYAHPSSMVGSIGVIFNGFGFVDTMRKLGVERRVMTAGENKASLDPFSPISAQEKQHVQKMLNQIHDEFIQAVKQGRGQRLADNDEIFSGLFWSGQGALELGLIDGFGSLYSVANTIVGEPNVVDYSYQPNWYEQVFTDFGVSLSTAIKETFIKQTSPVSLQ